MSKTAKKMDARTLTALRGSVRKWEKIVEGTGRDLGSSNCPLCALFNPAYHGGCSSGNVLNCRGCPVYEKTRQSYCVGIPYDDVQHERAEYLSATKIVSDTTKIASRRALDRANLQMLKFLQSLLPS